jgi:putative phosphonate metabolism protein
MRYGIYYTPPRASDLHLSSVQWLGRDAFDGHEVELSHPFAEAVVSPKRYGFHGTLKAPFHLKEPFAESQLVEAFHAFASKQMAFDLPQVELGRLGSFFALVPSEPNENLQKLADACVESFEKFRAPLSDAEIKRRNPEQLDPRQRSHLDQWGYPYVFDEFRFHLTLTDRVSESDTDEIETLLRERFAEQIGQPLKIENIAIYVEPAPGEAFRILAISPLCCNDKTVL